MAQELKDYDIMDIEAMDDERLEKSSSGRIFVTRVYIKDEMDAVLAEKDSEIRRLKEFKDKYSSCAEKAIDSIAKCELKIRGLQRALWLTRAERYKMREFIAREEANLRDQMAWSQFLRERTYNQWVDQLLRIANLANKLHNKCRAKAEEYK